MARRPPKSSSSIPLFRLLELSFFEIFDNSGGNGPVPTVVARAIWTDHGGSATTDDKKGLTRVLFFEPTLR